MRPLALAVACTLLPLPSVAADTDPNRGWECAASGAYGPSYGPGTWTCRGGQTVATTATTATEPSPESSGPNDPEAPSPVAAPLSPVGAGATGAAPGAPVSSQPPSAGAAPVASTGATTVGPPARTAPAPVPPPPRMPLPPIQGLPPLPMVVDPRRQDFTGPSPWVLPPAERQSPAASPRLDLALGPLPESSERIDDPRLYENLPWDFCGPRIVKRLPGQKAPEGMGFETVPFGPSSGPIDAEADRADYDRASDVARLRGNVKMVQGDRRLDADSSVYNRQSGDVDAEGNLYLEYPGGRLAAGRGHYNLTTGQGTMEQVRYRIAQTANLRGTAEEAELLSGTLTRYRDVTYTSCPPGHDDWSLRASDLELDNEKGVGTARNARVRLANIPVFYSPYLSFPIGDKRRSGFLIPVVGNSNDTGFDLTIPYYWNIAPNLDATLFPRFMSTRGIMLGSEVRALTPSQRVTLEGQVLPHDEQRPDYGARGAARIEQTGQLGGRWSTGIDASWVSDDQYLADFGNRLDVTSLRNLDRHADLSYGGDWYNLFFRLQGFQTIDPTIPASDRPYAQLPHLELNVPTRNLGPFEYAFMAHYDYFDHTAKVHGNREVVLPSVTMPIRKSYGYLVPRVRLFYTDYALTDTSPGQASRQSFLIPSLDVDGKLVFDRDTRWFGQQALQTLEPRLYYVLTPYENQTDTPLFDTTQLTFSYASLFRANRFTGYDRIGDDNRLTVGLTSRTIGDRSGLEWLRVSVGQIYFFNPQRLQLTGVAVGDSSTSAVAGEISTNPLDGLTARASFQWDPNLNQDQWEKRVLQLRYAPSDDRVLNLAYRYNLGQDGAESYENTDASFRWPITPQLGVVGRWLYSLLYAETVEAYAGIELGRCCWKLRLLARELKTSQDSPASTSVMLQLELKGLGAVGDRIDRLLERGIDGYEPD